MQNTDDETGDDAASVEALYAEASALAEAGKLAEAEPLYRRNVALLKETLGADDPGYGAALHELARVISGLGRYGEAESMLRRALVIFERAPGVEHVPYGHALQTLSGVLGAQDKFKDAETVLREALAKQEKALGDAHAALGPTLTNLAIALVHEERLEEAEPVVMRALRIKDAANIENADASDAETARILTIAAQVQAALGREEAPATARRALAVLVATHGADHPLVQDVEPMLKDIADPPGDLDAQLQAGAEALEARDAPRAIAVLGPLVERAREEGILPLEASASGMLAQALFVTGKREEALVLARRAQAIAEEAAQEDAAQHFRDIVAAMEGAEAGARIPNAFEKRVEDAVEQARAGDPKGASTILADLADEAQEAGALGAEATARIVLGQILRAIGDDELATAHLRRALIIAEQVGDHDAATHVRAMLGSS